MDNRFATTIAEESNFALFQFKVSIRRTFSFNRKAPLMDYFSNCCNRERAVTFIVPHMIDDLTGALRT